MAGKKGTHNSDSSSGKWGFIVYDEGFEQAIELIDERKLMVALSPAHDSDKNADGSVKKTHWHGIYVTANGRSIAYSTAVRDLQGIAANNEVQVVNNRIGNERYFCHLDNEDKVLYDEEDIMLFNGYELEYQNTDKEIESKIYDILFCEYLASRKGSFNDFILYLRENYPHNFPQLFHFCVKNTYFLNTVFKG